jgi:hypothetical protein
MRLVELLLLFLLGLLCFLRFLGHVALRCKVGSMQVEFDMHNSNYTTIAKLILRASKRVNDRHTVAACDRTKPLRDESTQRTCRIKSAIQTAAA